MKRSSSATRLVARSYALASLLAAACAARRAPTAAGSAGPAEPASAALEPSAPSASAGVLDDDAEPPASTRAMCAPSRPGRLCYAATLSQLGWDAPETRFEERPARAARLRAFELDRDEVSAGAYAECVRAGRCREPACDRADELPASQGPARCVAHRDAAAYCAFRGGRLPTEAEWERAAAGALPGHRAYPWGDAPPRADALPRDRTPEGARNLGGGVAEWVLDVGAFYVAPPRDAGADGATDASAPPAAAPSASASADPSAELEGADGGAGELEVDPGALPVVDDPRGPREGPWRVVRGGDLALPMARWSTTLRRFRLPDERRAWIGLRCAYDGPAAPSAPAPNVMPEGARGARRGSR